MYFIWYYSVNCLAYYSTAESRSISNTNSFLDGVIPSSSQSITQMGLSNTDILIIVVCVSAGFLLILLVVILLIILLITTVLLLGRLKQKRGTIISSVVHAIILLNMIFTLIPRWCHSHRSYSCWWQSCLCYIEENWNEEEQRLWSGSFRDKHALRTITLDSLHVRDWHAQKNIWYIGCCHKYIKAQVMQVLSFCCMSLLVYAKMICKPSCYWPWSTMWMHCT